ncbi:MAG: mannitol dehydrogenase family protein [Saccharofermentans sp.]|nr:mannitol dehydrogenase family protein [Saccharofermentans sp.]
MPELTLADLKSGRYAELPVVETPIYDIDEMIKATMEEPVWLHFGAGNIFRIFIAGIADQLLNNKSLTKGIIAADLFDGEIIDEIYKPHDNLTLAASMRADGHIYLKIVASVAEAINGTKGEDQNKRLIEIASSPSLQMMSFTITEKGYALKGLDGEYLNVVKSDIENGPDNCIHAMSRVCALLLARYKSCKKPLALVSMDNCSHNGDKLMESILTIAEEWNARGFLTEDFINWIEENVTFPLTMIDKITPRPDREVQEKIEKTGISSIEPITTSKGTYIAPFVNAEIPQYLVIEDKFPAGRPDFQNAGVYMTDRDTVNKVEKMKVTTCLNPLHTALAVFGCLLGYKKIADEMKDEDLVKLVNKLGYGEAMKVVTNPGIIDPDRFIKEVIEERLPNPYIPDMPQRIATDTSLKMPIRFGETIKSYIKDPELDVNDLTIVPLVIAGWMRYLLAKDDQGNDMELSSDPMLAELQGHLKDVVWNDPESAGDALDPILKNDMIFATDLMECGLGDKVKSIFREMLEGEYSVRKTIRKYTD